MLPIKMLGAVPQSMRRHVIRNCSSIGLSKRPSRSPVRTSSANSLQLSRKSISIRPFMAKKQPTKKKYWGSFQPAIAFVRAKTVRKNATRIASQRTSTETLTRKLPRKASSRVSV